MHLLVECQAPGRMQLCHEDDDHLLLGIDGERRIEESAPRIRTHRSKLRKRLLYALNSEAQPEALIRPNLSELIVRHQLDSFPAEQASVADFAFIEHHLGEPRVIHC